MLKGHEYRVFPTEDQEVLLSKHLGSCRWFYNFALNKKISHGSEPEIDTLRKEVAQEKECAIRTEAPSP